MKISFDTNGNEKQKEVARLWINNSTTDIVYGGSKGSGKSFLGCSLILGDALIYPNTHYFIARKSLTNLRKFTIPSLHEVLQIWGIDKRYYKYNGQDNYFTFYNGSKIFLLDASYLPSDPQYYRFGSMQMTRGWIEEAGEFEVEAKNNLNASIGRWKNEEYGLTAKLLQTCNPSKNYLYADYYKPNKEGILSEWRAFIQALPQDNKMLDDGYLENLHRSLSINEKERLLFGNWEFEDDPLKIMDYNKILELFTNEFVPPKNERYMTCDIAYEGSDIFVIGLWYGLVLEMVVAIDKIDDTRISKKINDIRVQYRVPLGNIAYDADGLKTFTRHAGKEGSLVGAYPFHNGGSPIGKENYFNLKAQCWFKMADMVAKNEIYIKDKVYRKQIIEELEQIKKVHRYDDKEPLRIEKKDELKKRLGRSPDFADMIMMRAVFEFKRPIKNNTSNWAGALG